MHRHPNQVQGGEQALQGVGEGQGGGGVGEQEGGADEHHNAHHHEKGVENPLIGDGKDPEGHQRGAGGVEHIENAGEYQQNNHGFQAAQQSFGADVGHRAPQHQQGQHHAVGDKPVGQKQGHQVADEPQQLHAGVQTVEKGVAGEKLPQGNVLQVHPFPPFRASKMASRACSTVYTEAGTSKPMARSRAKTRVISGTPSPICSSSGPWENTSWGVPE